MKIVEFIAELKEDLEYLKQECYQRHIPQYYAERTYYQDLCSLIDKLDLHESVILGDKIRKENKQYADNNLDYESYLQGLIGYNYQVKKYNLYQIVDKVIIPELEKAQIYLLQLFNLKRE